MYDPASRGYAVLPAAAQHRNADTIYGMRAQERRTMTDLGTVNA
jgi:hypothetical protein